MTVYEEYRRIRQDRVTRYTGTGRIYHHKVPAAAALRSARRLVDITTRWDAAVAEGLVRLTVHPDYDADIEDLAGDAYNPIANPEIQPHILTRQYKEFADRVNREGVWGIQSEHKCQCCGQWVKDDAVWGFVGDDWEGSGYDLDLKAVALAAIE